MHRQARLITTTAVVALATAGLSGCAFFGPPRAFADDASVNASVDAIRLDDPAGGVTVRAVAGTTTISLERTVHYFGAERDWDDTHAVEGGTLVLDGCGNRCSVDYVLEVPEGLDVSGSTSNGAIVLSGVAAVDVSTSNGRIELDEVSGEVEATTSNGRITGERLTGGAVRAESSNGAIELRLGTAQDVDADTSNGAIEIEVPDDDGYAVDAETSNGGVDVDIADDPDGEHRLELRTSNGAIRVSAAS